MAIIRQDNVSGTLDSSGLPLNSSTMSSAGLATLPPVAGGDVAYLVVNPFASNARGPEVIAVTSHGTGATTATVLRGVNPAYPQQDHPAGTIWVCGPTKEDFDNFQTQLDQFFTTALFTAAGDSLRATGVGTVARQPGPDAWKVDRGDPGAPTKVSASYGLTLVCTRATRPTQNLYVGMKIIETDTYHELMWTGAAWRYQDDAPGTIKLSANGTLLPGFVWADGSLLDGSIAPNQDLFAFIGTAYGAGSGSHFNVPDYRETMPIGYDFGAGAPSPVRVSGTSTIGLRGGASSVTLTTLQLPSHSHSGSAGNTAPSFSGSTSTDGDHYHKYGSAADPSHQVDTQQSDFQRVPFHDASAGATTGLAVHSPGTGDFNITFSSMVADGDHNHSVSGSVASHSHAITIGSTGGGNPLIVQNPFQTCAFMVRL